MGQSKRFADRGRSRSSRAVRVFMNELRKLSDYPEARRSI